MSDKRYIRQTSLPGFGEINQQKLKESSVLIIGMGGLGCPVAQYLNSMGVGRLGLMDYDLIELSNLHRQVLYSENNLGQYKVDIAHNFLSSQNSNTYIVKHKEALNQENAIDIIAKYELIVDCTDNIASRYLINDACTILDKPFVSGSMHRNEGQIALFNYRGGASYRCLYPQVSEDIMNCSEAGVLGVLPGIVGTQMALLVIKALTGYGETPHNQVLIIDALKGTQHSIKLSRVKSNFERTALEDSYNTPLCSSNDEIGASELYNNPDYLIIDVREKTEFDGFHIENSINLPLSSLDNELTEYAKDTPILFICQSGKRSLSALNSAKIAAFSNIKSLKGGIDAYLATIKPVDA